MSQFSEQERQNFGSRSETEAHARPSIATYVVTHHASAPIEIPGLQTIFCGDKAWEQGPGAITDNLQDGSCLINRRWSELSAIYKVWRDGPRTDIVGFYHYRRYLASGQDQSWHTINMTQAELSARLDAILDVAQISRVSNDLGIVPMPHGLGKTVVEQYRELHIAGDYELMREIAIARFPELREQLELQDQNQELYLFNIFHLSWERFSELCEIWFNVLWTFAAGVNWPRGQGAYQDRDVAFLAERLFDAWIRTKRAAGMQFLERPIIAIDWTG